MTAELPPAPRPLAGPPVQPARRPLIHPLLVITIVLGVLILGMGTAAWWVTIEVERPYKAWSGDDVFVNIPQGAGVAAITRRLSEAGLIEHPFIFRLSVWQQGAERQLKAGEYRFDRPMAPRRLVAALVRGDVHLRPLTFPEGLVVSEMAALYEQGGFGTAAAFELAAQNVSLIADLDPAAPDLEGYLFPDTYQLPRRVEATDLVKSMVARFREVAGPVLPEVASTLGWTTREWVTLASLVEKETRLDAERPLVAAVYANRVRIGMGLQCDPTVIYALRLAGQWQGNLTRENLQIDSPYNTYRYRGLPPGPIASPGKASLLAAASPARVDFLYFVSRNDGSHVFSATLAEHNLNVRRFQIEYFRQRRLEQRGG
ncbi:MAG: endolytic transglycosylase MltG [Vicinamibacterales bacterium]